MNSFISSVSSKIRARRIAVGMSKTGLSRASGISLSTVYALEDGLMDYRLSTVCRVAMALGINPEELVRVDRDRVVTSPLRSQLGFGDHGQA